MTRKDPSLFPNILSERFGQNQKYLGKSRRSGVPDDRAVEGPERTEKQQQTFGSGPEIGSFRRQWHFVTSYVIMTKSIKLLTTTYEGSILRSGAASFVTVSCRTGRDRAQSASILDSGNSVPLEKTAWTLFSLMGNVVTSQVRHWEQTVTQNKHDN
jgi:hypothetical protein